MFAVITAHIHSMETENTTTTILKRIPIDILDRIAQFLPFHDVETDEEFIERTQALTIRKAIPEICYFPYEIQSIACSPDNAIYALSGNCNGTYDVGHDIVQYPKEPNDNFLMINRKTNKKQQYGIGKNHHKLAISSDEKLVAIIRTSYNMYPINGFVKEECLKVTHSESAKIRSDYHDITSYELRDNHPAIAFNKQGTKIIVHTAHAQHIIFSVPSNQENQNTDNKKTFAKYCAQRGICKNLIK